MCGIAGIWSLSPEFLKEEKFIQSLELLRHRGPDQERVRQSNHYISGAQRLKIIDLEKGSQPLYDQNGNSLVFNGAIYNYPELAKRYQIISQSDSCILFEMLKEKGELAIDQLRGMFAFAYYNEQKDQLLLARDRVGQKPLYYYHDENCFLFASELKALKQMMLQAGITPEINQEAIFHYLCLSNIPEPETIYKHVYALSPGYQLMLSGGNLSFTKFWDYSYKPKSTLEKEDILKETLRLIQEAVKLRLRADVPLGLFLSAGWDSSIIAYEIAKLTKDIKAYTISYPFATSQNESAVAARTAKQLGLTHQTIPISLNPLASLKEVLATFDQPFADSSAIPNLAIAKAAGQEVKVMLNGDGGDEQFGGYRRYFLAKHASKMQFVNRFTGLFNSESDDRRSKSGFIKRIGRIMQSTDSSRYLRYTVDMLQDEDLGAIWNGAPIHQPMEDLISRKKVGGLMELDQLMHYDRKFNLLSGILVKMDRASMAYSVEARSPFLDHQLFDFTSKLPDKYKVNGSNRKYLLKALYADKLPKEVVKGKKISFEAPLSQWLAHDFKELIEEVLKKPEAKLFRYLDYEEVQSLLSGQKYHERNVGYLIYSLLILALWLEENT